MARVNCRHSHAFSCSRSYNVNFLAGMKAGVEGVLQCIGYWDSDSSVKSSSNAPSSETAMQVISIGMGRTGTTSLVLALEKIGYRAFHDDEVKAPLLSKSTKHSNT